MRSRASLCAFLCACAVAAGVANCPAGTTQIDTFVVNATAWLACEDLTVPDGALALVRADGRAEWFPKTFSMYGSSHDEDPSYYLGLGKQNVTQAAADVLGMAMLAQPEITLSLVADAVPPIKGFGGARTFVGSRGSVADTTFDSSGEDASQYGFPPAASFVFNLSNAAEGGAPMRDRNQYVNNSGMAEGLVGGELPAVIFYYPVMRDSPYLPPAVAAANRSRYWTMIAVGAPDMLGSREQSVLFRFQQLECDGTGAVAPAAADASCHLVGAPMYWDTFWWSRAPPGASGATNATGPLHATASSDFYSTLLETRRWWDAELAQEGMMELSLPSDARTSTNGTWLATEARHNLILSMITKHDTWGPRYGVLPGYGITMQNGFEDVFTSTAQAAVEFGAMEYARGLIENQFSHYIMDNGMTKYRAIEVAQQARMLTILALFHAYAGGSKDDDAFLLRHFKRAKTIADWLVARRNRSLARYNTSDPRYGLIAGNDEGDDFTHIYFHQGDPYTLHQFWYGHSAEAYRAFAEIGQAWSRIGAACGRADVAAHGAELLALAPKLYASLHSSLNKTRNTTASPGHVCYSDDAGMFGANPSFGGGCAFRSYSELFHSGALTEEQTDAMYISGQGNTTCPVGRWLTDGSPSGGGADPLIFVHIPQGLPFGLLTHDMIDRFLLYFFHQAAHANTRGTFTTPESTKLDRNGGGYAYASAGLGNVPMALKWMMCFEEMETRTLWLAKATPRDWLATGAQPVVASRVATRYGRVAFSLAAPEPSASAYAVRANITLPASFVRSGNATVSVPPGGIRLRLRVPLPHAGRLATVSVGGKQWTAFSAAEETVDFSADALADPVLVTEGLQDIVATFDLHTGAQPVPLRRARVDPARRVVPVSSNEVKQVASVSTSPKTKATSQPEPTAVSDKPECPDNSTLVDSFIDTSAGDNVVWSACEDLQRPDGDIVLVSSHVPVPQIERFSKSYAPFTTNWTDDEHYYLGLGKQTVANATTDLMGAKLLADHREAGLSWSDVERAVPVIRKSGKRGDGRWGSNCQGVRTFVGSRSAAVDTTFDDHGGDCNWEGWPSWESYAVNMHNKAMGEPMQAYNGSISADGNVGDELPTAIFYLPMHDNGTSLNRYWTYFAVAVPDQCPEPANGCREQNVVFRFQQLECAGPMGTAGGPKAPCKMIDWPMYWDSYWFSRFPGANKSDTAYQTLLTGPVNATSSSDFYSTLLASRRWWNAELAKEGMMELRHLPSPATTNGTWLALQARQAIVRSMITRENKWHPRYGVRPGYGDIVHDGLLSVFTSTATAALEFGAMAYARGVVENQFNFYVRDDGMVWYRSIELPATARMLTVLAKYHSYAYNDDDPSGADAFLLQHFSKARAVATLLLARRSASASLYDSADPRHGIPRGGDEARDGDDAAHINQDTAPLHWYASAAELYRACTDLGTVWYDIGRRTNRSDIEAHGREMLAVAPQLRLDMQASLNKTVTEGGGGSSATPVERCWQLTAEAGVSNTSSQSLEQASFRGFAEMFYSGAMTPDQIADIYASASGGSKCGATRFLTLGSPGLAHAPGKASLASPWSYGFAYGLLQADMVEEFLLHYFTMSAHGYTRGSFTTPESANLADRDEPAIAYAASGVAAAPTYLKWLLLFEEPETQTLWLAKATPRDWLALGENPLVVDRATTRYGRVSFSMAAASTASGAYSVRVNVTLPVAVTSSGTLGGVRVRIRAPQPLAGKLSSVIVGGAPWHKFDAKDETINFDAADLSSKLIESLQDLVATFA